MQVKIYLAPSPSYSGERAGVRGIFALPGVFNSPAPHPALSPVYRGEGRSHGLRTFLQWDDASCRCYGTMESSPDSLHFSPRRAGIVVALIVAALLALIGRVAYLQTYGREQTIRQTDRQQHMTETLFARRGTVYDSTGNVLAGTVQTQALFVDPKFMFEQFQANGLESAEIRHRLDQLADLVEMDRHELTNLLDDKSESRFVKIKEDVSDDYISAIHKLGIDGVGLTPIHERYYPMGSLAAHVLGGVGSDGRGLEGLELSMEKLLAGQDGAKRTKKDARRRGIYVAAEDYLPPIHGQHLVLTIDANIQMIAEQELAAACEKYRAKAGECVVMDPYTGEIVALANYPTFNPQHLQDSKPEWRNNRAAVVPFEPGSTIKPYIVGPAMAWGLLKAGEVWPLPKGGGYKSSLRSKRVTDIHYYGPMATWDILVKSSNIGMTMIGERMGKPRIHAAIQSFGFGQKTGIETQGEDAGMLLPPGKWGNADVVSTVQGYRLMVTPLQLARAMSVYANGGRLISPHLLKAILNPEGQEISKYDPQRWDALPQVVDTYTASQMRRILADVPVRGTGRDIDCTTYNLFGKTGTAHVAKNGNYNETNYTSSFVGGGPYENPRLVVAFIIHEPDKSLAHYGGKVSAPSAGNVLERSLAYLQVPPSPQLTPPPANIANVLVNFDPKVYAKRLKGQPVLASGE